MTQDRPTIDVRHEPERDRFVVIIDGVEAVLDYRRQGDVISLVHTIVPEQIGGRGVAAALVRTALDYSRAEGLKVVPACSYVEAYFRKHPQDADLLAT